MLDSKEFKRRITTSRHYSEAAAGNIRCQERANVCWHGAVSGSLITLAFLGAIMLSGHLSSLAVIGAILSGLICAGWVRLNFVWQEMADDWQRIENFWRDKF